ncbi:MAG: hypothetical protein K8F91_07185, partial [Candidatus Obscuribacterales bacterium]|nr:hypothetical protein [Candidatus Obscuribacterales bacterium]
MTNDWTWHVDALKSRLSELNETIETIKNSVEKRPGLETATRAMAPLLTGNQSELSHFPAVLGNILKDPLLGALLVGPQGEFVLFNLPAQDMLGREYLSGSGRVGYRILDVSQTLALEARDLPWNKALGGESLNDVRLYLSGDEGFESRWLSVSATPFRGHQNEVYGAVVFMIDSTEEITLESSIGAICNTISSQIAQVGSTHNQLKDLSDKLSNTGVQRLLTKGAEPGYQEGLGGKPSQEKKSQANRKTSPPLDSIPEPPEQQAAILDALDNDSPPLPDSTFSTVETDGFAFSDSK